MRRLKALLGLLLWNVAFNVMFRVPTPRRTTTISYADETLVVAKSDSVYAMQKRANAAFERSWTPSQVWDFAWRWTKPRR